MDKFHVGYIAVLLGVGFLGYVLRSWVEDGRMKKEAPYVTTRDCENHREKCCITVMKRDVADISARVVAAEKRLDKGSEDFKDVKKELSGINKTLAGMQVLIETKIEKIVIKS